MDELLNGADVDWDFIASSELQMQQQSLPAVFRRTLPAPLDAQPLTESTIRRRIIAAGRWRR